MSYEDVARQKYFDAIRRKLQEQQYQASKQALLAVQPAVYRPDSQQLQGVAAGLDDLGLPEILDGSGKPKSEYLFGAPELFELETLHRDTVKNEQVFTDKDEDEWFEEFGRHLDINDSTEAGWNAYPIWLQVKLVNRSKRLIEERLASGIPQDPFERTHYFQLLDVWASKTGWTVRRINAALAAIVSKMQTAASKGFAFAGVGFGEIKARLAEDVFQESFREPLHQFALQLEVLMRSLSDIFGDSARLNEEISQKVEDLDRFRERIAGVLYSQMKKTIESLQHELDSLRARRQLFVSWLSYLNELYQGAAETAKAVISATVEVAKEVVEGALDAAEEAQKAAKQYKWLLIAGAAVAAFALWKMR